MTATQLNVRSASGHVCRNRNRVKCAGFGDDFGFVVVVGCVQDATTNTGLLHRGGQLFRFIHAGCAYQNRSMSCVFCSYLADQRGQLGLLVHEHTVWMINSNPRAVRWDDDNFQIVKFVQLTGRFLSRTRHPGEAVVEFQEILHRDGIQDAALRFNFQSLFCLQSGLDSAGPATVFGNASGEFVDQFNLTFANDVINVAFQQDLRMQSNVQPRQQPNVCFAVQLTAT